MKHSKKQKKIWSEKRKLWWKNIKENNPEKYKKVCEKISKNHARPSLGKIGEKSTGWKGGRFTTKRDGYVFIYQPEHPNAKRSGTGGGGYVLEHRLVMEKILGRYLLPDEDVNHINGKKDDNRPENLTVVRHYAHYQEMKCPKCEFIFRTR